DDFGDSYFSTADGLAESHYVFYEQYNIDTRLQTDDPSHFVIPETGLGTGLNFLKTWQHFNDHIALQQSENQLDQGGKRLH
ncbi:bifunctional tRNA (5-methylaminomethyl-2-thiouridine)(34)-methyltransferase MnmD/FAD-dependent 5-carboxymethylaminomethyl-2-thiouridine(34) oxidoreductase MnmC, partial [Pseudoalteromonas sp. S185]